MAEEMSEQELRVLKRMEKKDDREQEEVKQQKQKSKKNKLYLGVILLIVIGGGYGVASLSNTGNSVDDYDVSGIPAGFIHWHADVDVIVCGEDKPLPEGLPGQHIGSNILHTHDRTENVNSMPNSDGNGVIHIEGSVLDQPQEGTVGKFMDLMNIPFSETQLMNKKNGDTCPDGKQGMVKFFVNGKENVQWRKYIPRDGDFIRIEFAAAPTGEQTAMSPKEVTVEMTASGFNPSTVTIKKGDKVTWVNKETAPHWPASAFHPTHTKYPGSDIQKCGTVEEGNIFDACKGIETEGTYSFTFNEIGKWNYHDHLKPTIFGSVMVEEA